MESSKARSLTPLASTEKRSRFSWICQYFIHGSVIKVLLM